MINFPIILSVALLIGGLLFFRRSQHAGASEKVVERLSRGFISDDKVYMGFLQRELLRSGISLTIRKLVFIFSMWLLILVLAFVVGGVLVCLITLIGSVLFVRAYLAIRFHRRLQKMISQLPQFLDHIIRSLKSGRTLGDGFVLAIENSQDPLKGAFLRTRNNIQRGMPLTDAINDFASLYKREEFHMLALSIAVNQRYGGNASEVLKNLITLIRDKDLASRQLRALTGETRMSAIVLGSMPTAMAGYLFLSSPELLLGMWEQSAGQLVLLFAFALQAIGIFVLWRMMKSI